MASICDVAKYILSKMGNMTTMKLQKLCYYCQAWSLAWDDVPLFEEDFEAWANGPVCPELFAKHKGKFIVDASLFDDIDDYKFSDAQIETMDAVLDYYGDKEPHWLSELTHKEDPWRLTRVGVPMGATSNKVIEKELIQSYYGGLSE